MNDRSNRKAMSWGVSGRMALAGFALFVTGAGACGQQNDHRMPDESGAPGAPPLALPTNVGPAVGHTFPKPPELVSAKLGVEDDHLALSVTNLTDVTNPGVGAAEAITGALRDDGNVPRQT